jgi:hypothetical protein
MTFLLFILLSFDLSRGATWTLTDAQFNSRQVDVQSVDAAGIHFAASATTQPSVLPWQNVLELSQSANPASPAAGRMRLCFASGDVLSGEPMGLNNDTLQWNSARMSEIDVPLDQLLGIVVAGASPSDLDQTRADDVIRLANGDTTHGIVTQIAPAGVTIQSGDTTPTLSWDSIAAVLFSSATTHSPAGHGPMFRLHFVGEESVTVAGISMEGDKITAILDEKNSRPIDPWVLTGIEQIDGPISWLTSRKPAENIYKPFFSENFPTRFDRTVADGKPIREKYPAFHHGIGCHAYSKLTYDLDGNYAAFRTQFAIDSDSPLADATVRIYLDNKPVFERKNVEAGPIYPVVTIPLAGAKKLSLEVDYGQNYGTEDRFVWLDPALVRTAQ